MPSQSAVGAPTVMRQLLAMTWLWDIFAGFYIVAYAFWLPRLFDGLLLVILLVLVTLALGCSLLFDGFAAARRLQTGVAVGSLPYVRPRHLVGGVALLIYTVVYLPPGGRIVAHWPLDLAITLLSGLILVYYAIVGVGAQAAPPASSTS
jgi:hypothetical protein